MRCAHEREQVRRPERNLLESSRESPRQDREGSCDGQVLMLMGIVDEGYKVKGLIDGDGVYDNKQLKWSMDQVAPLTGVAAHASVGVAPSPPSFGCSLSGRWTRWEFMLIM